MKLKEIVDKLNLEVKTPALNLERKVSGGYVSDLLSDVIANARQDNIWITLQIHQNIVAVAVLKELAGIIIVNGRSPEDEVLKKAEEENIPIILTGLPSFEIVGRLYNLGIRGINDAKGV
ncbi:MAG: serine kinase [Candidatus Eremiobacteraeota bacterium]|nr:serine kinase [Candidatus Eremiobacteraeota bacterium]